MKTLQRLPLKKYVSKWFFWRNDNTDRMPEAAPTIGETTFISSVKK